MMPRWVKTLLLSFLERLRRACRACLFRVRFFGRAVKVDSSSRVSWRAVICTAGGGSISIGKSCEIHAFSMLLTYGGHISIGDNCSVNPFAIVYGHGGVKIGDRVRIAAHTVIIPANHNIPAAGAPLHQSGTTAKGIAIDNDVWIGATAIEANEPLVTRDGDRFSRISGLTVLGY